jgi:hypothetical protein
MSIDKQLAETMRIMTLKSEASERAWQARADMEEAFPEIDAGTGRPRGKFIRVYDELDVHPDNTTDLDFSIRVDWSRCSVGDFVRIAKILEKHFPEYVKGAEQKVEVSDVVKLLTLTACQSRSEAKRLVAQGAVSIDGKKVTDPYQHVEGKVRLQVGKKFDSEVEAK